MSNQSQRLLSYDAEDDQSQGQLRREDFESEQTESSRLINQTSDSVKTMAYGATGIATGAARGAMGLAQGAAIGAANLAQGAATAVKNSLGNNPESHNLHAPLPKTQSQKSRY